MSASVQRKLQHAHQSLGRGDVATAAALCEDVLARAPRNPEALWLLGTARLMENRADVAVPLLERAAAVVPNGGSILESLGLAYLMTGDYAAAEGVLVKAVAIPAAPPSVRMRLGLALLHQNKYDAAVRELEQAASAQGQDFDIRMNLGRAYAGARRWSEAMREFERALALAPGQTDALFNAAVARAETGDVEGAQSRFEQVLSRDRNHADSREQLAALHMRVGRFAHAAEHLRELIRIRPRDAGARAALSEACFQQGALDNAEQAAREAVGLDPSMLGAFGVLARVHYVRGELDRAVEVLEHSEAARQSRPLLGLRMHLLHRIAEWARWKPVWEELRDELDSAPDLGSPFSLLCEHTTAAQQLSYTRRWAAARFANVKPYGGAVLQGRTPRERLRVGYFSSDFQEHAVAHLLVEALESHDRERFDIYAYSYGPEDGSEMRRRLRTGVEHFIDISRDADDEAVRRIRADELDLLVDLRGYTAGDRLEIMAHRPAPVQATWLGYPGTTGADFIDYLIADNYIIPPEDEEFYSERVLRLPICYQPNDSKRSMAEPLSRSAYGLPEQAFVFCCFNQAVKILPEVFACWMRLLRSVPESVLWLLDDNRWATENLKRAAAAEGIAPERVVAAERMANPEHLARFKVADLSLDTYPYTSHTTASDSLWAGSPLVALSGDTFASRVSGSILSACGFGDLVTRNLDDYETLARRLATSPDEMRTLKARLDAARTREPLFDSRIFARDLEKLFVEMTSAGARD